ncbi:MAG TPA: protein kinase [Kofleriaceae bacterium]|jgi:WD40 repeat protein/serine/threonine protein kinase|nr:protein kinase [Kofleriaceae bacterium]
MVERVLSGRTLGEFILREQIGEGGHGVVYRGEQPLLERDVVIKVMRERCCDEVSQRRFLREVKLASLLDHPYAAHVYAFGVEAQDGLLWIAMERVRGVPLDRWLEAHGPMPLEQFVPFFECVAQVVHAAHEQGIVHRDLKPSNIMVVEHGGRLFPKLLDFGIAKADLEVTLPVPARWPDGSLTPDRELAEPDPDDVDTLRILRRPRSAPRIRVDPDPAGSSATLPGLTPFGACIGSQPYMAPEQWCNAEAVGPAADVYALGVVAYQALSGRLPFIADTTGEYFLQHRHEQVPSLGGSFPSDLDRAIRCALDKYPEHRPGNTLELASALRAALRASKREHLRASAQQWHDQAEVPGLLWRADVLEDAMRSVPREALSNLECSFVAESQRRIRRTRWIRRSLVALAVGVAIGGFHYRAVMQARMADQIATEAEVEQGRQALLHGESAEALLHLAQAYQRGDHSPSSMFMLSHALAPWLAERARFTTASGPMWSAAFSPDGHQIVTTDSRGARVWDAQTHQLRFALPHGDTAYQAVYSADGTTLVTAGGDGVVKMWSAATGALLRALRPPRQATGSPPRYFAVGVSPDGLVVAAIDSQGKVAHAWDAHTGALLAEIPNDGSWNPALAFSADGRWLATSGGDDVRVFDTRTWTQALTLSGQHIRTLAFDPTGPRLVTGSSEGDASIWAIPSGQRLRHLRDVGEPIDVVAFSPSGELVVTASRDGAEQVWNAGSGHVVSQLNYHRTRLTSVEFDSSSQRLLAAGLKGAVVVSDVAQGLPIAVLGGAVNAVRSAHFDPTSRRVIGASLDSTVRVWDAIPPYRRWSTLPIGVDCDTAESLEPDQRFIALSCQNHGTHVWDTARGELLAELPAVTLVDGDYYSAFPAVSAAGDRAAIARGHTVEIYALPGAHLIRTIAHGAPVNAVAFAPLGHDVISGAIDGSLFVTRDDREPLALPASAHGIDVAGFLGDRRIVAVDASRRLRVIDTQSHAVLAELEAPTRVRSLRLSPGGRLVTIPVRSKPAPPVLWDLESYRIVAQLAGHAGRVFSARFVRGGHDIMTSAADGTARLWDARTGRPRQIFSAGVAFLFDATLSPDGAMVVAGGADGSLRFWDATTGHQLWALPVHRSYVIGIHFEGDEIVTRSFIGDVARWSMLQPISPGVLGNLTRCQLSFCDPTIKVGE